MPTLAALGWDATRTANSSRSGPSSSLPGRVSLEHNHVYRVLTEAGEVLAEASSDQTPSQRSPRTAGRGGLGRAEAGSAGRPVRGLRRFCPGARRSPRKAAGRGTEEQVIAANVDVRAPRLRLGQARQRPGDRALPGPRQSQRRPVGRHSEQGRSVRGRGASDCRRRGGGGCHTHSRGVQHRRRRRGGGVPVSG